MQRVGVTGCGTDWKRATGWFWLACLGWLLTSACEGSDAPYVSLRISAPVDDAVLTTADDEDPNLPGLQYSVVAEARGVERSDAFELRLDDQRIAIGVQSPDRVIRFERVTLLPGHHELVARTTSGSIRSEARSYTLVSLQITAPTDGQRLGAADDEDPASAGTQRSVRVQGFGLEPAAEVALWVDDVPAGSGTLDENGLGLFERVSFEPGPHVLLARSGSVTTDPVRVEVAQPCPRLDLVSPTISAGTPLVLGPRDDRVGAACGDEFGIDVVVATNAEPGSLLRLLVNGTTAGSIAVDGTVARFDGVVLGNRGDTGNRLGFEIEHEGITCDYDIDASLFVDCEGVSCSITAPSTGYLNAHMDSSLEPEFQGEFQVTTDLNALSQAVALVIDGDVLNLRYAMPAAMGASARATFALTLAEGAHRLIALCSDPSGNVTASSEASWVVDTVPCEVSVTSPRDGAFVLDADDVDATTDGVQLDVQARVSGEACERARVGACGGLASMPLLPISGTMTVGRTTLSTASAQELCVEVHDAAGNSGSDSSNIIYDNDAPRLQIAEPRHGLRINRLGNDYAGLAYTADLDLTTDSCEVDFLVRCSDLETDVTLHEHVSGQPIATAACDPAASPTGEYPGTARLPRFALPRLGTVAIHARQVAAGGRLTGISPPITLYEDCDAPTLAIAETDPPLCGSELGPSLNDATIARDVTVTTDDPAGVRAARLRVVPVGGGAAIADLVDNESPFEFAHVNFSALGEHDVIVEALDQAGNAASAPSCRVSVVDAPALSIEITEGADADSALEDEDDCGSADGLQVAITGTTDAPQNAEVSITVGSDTYATNVVCAGGSCGFMGCVDVLQGEIAVRVQVSDPARASAAVIERRIVVDSLPPSTAIADLTAAPADLNALRAGTVRLQWTDVADQGGIPLVRYDLRCADEPITSDALWLDATPLPLELTPAVAGARRSAIISGFGLYAPRHCMLRALDVADAITPRDDTSVSIDFFTLQARTVGGSSGSGMGRALAALGDVNGDARNDWLVGGTGFARIYFGQPDLEAPLRSVTISGPSDSFGASVAGLGDIDGDGVSDLAIGEPDAATIYILLGRDEHAATSPVSWPSTLDALTDTSLSFQSASMDRFGEAITGAGDVDGDGRSDIAIGAPEHSADQGRLYIVLGRPLCTMMLTTHCLVLGSSTTLGVSGGLVDGFVLSADTHARFATQLAALGPAPSGGRAALAIGAPGSSADDVDAALYVWPGAAYLDSDSGMVSLPFDLDSVSLGAPESGPTALSVINGQDGPRAVVSDGANIALIGLGSTPGNPVAALEARVLNDLGTGSDAFGASLGSGLQAGLGSGQCDIDGDGLDDLWTGSRTRGTGPGSSELFFRSRLRQTIDANLEAPRSAASFSSSANAGGRAVACVGDLNGDGHHDLVVGDQSAQAAGSLTLYY